MRFTVRIFWRSLWLVVILTSCARSPIRSPDQAMRPTGTPPLSDDLSDSGLAEGLLAQIRFLKAQSGGVSEFGFGPRVIDRSAYIRALEYLHARLKEDPSGQAFRAALARDFETFEVYGQDRWGEIFMTSYFEPVIPGSKRPTAEFSEPIYSKPKDLVDIDFGAFIATRPALSVLDQAPIEQRSQMQVLRGRLVKGEGMDSGLKVIPYLDRAAIYSGGLKGSGAKPLAYVRPIDGFVLEIQGSGVIELAGGQNLKVGYAGQNGHSYVPVGRHLFDVIPKEKMTLFALESHLRGLSREEARRIMELNPSYVFFQRLESGGLTFLGNELQTGRTIATDQAFFPKGALGFLIFDKPVFASEVDTEPARWERVSRFVFDQDTGGAIRGPGRVDLYAGRGQGAKQMAAVIKNKGRLVYFVPRADFISGLSSVAR